MDGMRWTVNWHFHDTMAANGVMHYKLPCDATLVQVDAVATNDSDATLVLGTDANADAYLVAAVIGDSATYATKDRGDFGGDSGHDTAECPHLSKGDVLKMTLDYDGAGGTAAQNADISLTFLEG
jgi:hypothetical protein